MKNIVLAVALTGSCALFYILYRIRSNTQEKKGNSKSDKMKDSISNLQNKSSRNEDINTILREETLKICCTPTDKLSSKLQEIEAEISEADMTKLVFVTPEEFFINTHITNTEIQFLDTCQEQYLIQECQPVQENIIQKNEPVNLDSDTCIVDSELENLENLINNLNTNICHASFEPKVPESSVEDLKVVEVKLETTLNSLDSNVTNHNCSEKSTILEHNDLSNNEIIVEPHVQNVKNKLESNDNNIINKSDSITKNSSTANNDKIETQSPLPETKGPSNKIKKQKRKGKSSKKNTQSPSKLPKELETSNIVESSTKSSDTTSIKNSCNELDSREMSPDKSNIKDGFWSIPKSRESESSVSLPDTCTSDLERETSQSPEQHVTSDSQSLASQGSLDSGQGSIEVDQDTIFSNIGLPTSESEQYISYQFEVPQVLVGKLIGRKGNFLNRIKSTTSSDILLVDHSIDEDLKLCSIEGRKCQVLQAVDMIREHFPVDQFPELTLKQVNNTPIPSPHHQPQVNRQLLQIELPPGVVLEVEASSVTSSGEVWLRQPLHPTFLALQRLHHCLNLNYEDGTSTPVLPLPIPTNTICVCQIRDQWLRAQVLDHDDTNCTVTLLDVGGHASLPLNLLRQIRVDYIGLPFQAAQCYLYGIEPIGENGWEEEGRVALEDLAKNNIIYAAIAAYSQDGIPLVNLYQRQYNQYLFLNERMVDLGHAKWIAA